MTTIKINTPNGWLDLDIPDKAVLHDGIYLVAFYNSANRCHEITHKPSGFMVGQYSSRKKCGAALDALLAAGMSWAESDIQALTINPAIQAAIELARRYTL